MDDAAQKVPEHLKEGWEIYQAWWMARYRSGDPLPMGGVFLINRRSILLDELARLKVEAASGLQLPLDAIQINLEPGQGTRVQPRVDVKFPRGWCPGGLSDSDPDRDRLVNEYVSGYLRVLYDALQKRLTRRLAALGGAR